MVYVFSHGEVMRVSFRFQSLGISQLIRELAIKSVINS